MTTLESRVGPPATQLGTIAPRRPRARRRAVIAATAILICAWLGWDAWQLKQAHDDIQRGRVAGRLVQGAGYEVILDGPGRAALAEARASFDAAADRLDSAALMPLRVVPVLGRQLRTSSALSGSVATALAAGASALDRLDAALDAALPSGPARPAALRRASVIAGDLGDELTSLDLGEAHGLIGRLADARAELVGDLAELTALVERTELVAAGLAEVFDGPGRWLLLAANSAQMQNGSGMFLSYAVMDVDAGRITIGDVTPTLDLVPAAPVELDPDQAAIWPWMDPNGDFRHLGTTPRFDVTAATAARLFRAAGHGEVTGVLALDPFAVRSLLRITGPVDVDGQPMDADRVVQDLLHGQYAYFEGPAPFDAAQAQRRDRLGLIARAAMDAFGRATSVDREGIEELVATAGARHLMAWSSEPAPQRAFEAAAIAGRLPEDGLLLSVLNRGGNKLDWSLLVDAELTFAPDAAGTLVEVRASLTNVTAPGEPVYVAGPYPGSGLAAGDYLGVAVLTVPGHASELEVVGADALVLGRDGDHLVIGSRVLVSPGATAQVIFRFRLPASARTLEIVPAARAQRTHWTLAEGPGQEQVWEDEAPRRLSLLR